MPPLAISGLRDHRCAPCLFVFDSYAAESSSPAIVSTTIREAIYASHLRSTKRSIDGTTLTESQHKNPNRPPFCSWIAISSTPYARPDSMPRFHRLEACEERPDQCERNGMEKYAHRCRVWRTTSRLKIVGRMDHLLQQPHSGQSMFCIWKKRVDPKSLTGLCWCSLVGCARPPVVGFKWCGLNVNVSSLEVMQQRHVVRIEYRSVDVLETWCPPKPLGTAPISP